MQYRHAGQCRLVHDERRPRRKNGLPIDKSEQFGHARIGLPGQREEAHRFRQPDGKDRYQQQRRHAADDEDRAPAELRNQRSRKQTAEGCPEREAAEHDHHHGGAPPMRVELRRHGNGVRHRAAEPKPGQKPDHQQRVDVLDERGRERTDAERQRGKNDDLLAPDAVSQRSQYQRADHQAEQAGTEHRTERALAQSPFLGQRGGHIADRRGVKAVEEQNRGTGQQQPDLEAADRLLVDEACDIDGRCDCFGNRHARSLPMMAGSHPRSASFE